MTPDYVAGHSLGEYSALVAAGSLRFADAVRLVRKRGPLHAGSGAAGVGAMAAILRLPEGKLDGILEQAAQGEVVSAANLNSPDQVVIAGPCRRGEPRGGTGQSGRSQARGAAAGQRAIPLFPDDAGAGTAAGRSGCHGVSRPGDVRW